MKIHCWFYGFGRSHVGLFQSCDSRRRGFDAVCKSFHWDGLTGNTYPGAQVPFGMVQLSRTTAFRGGTESQAITIRTVPLPDLAIRIFQELEQAICMIFLLCL